MCDVEVSAEKAGKPVGHALGLWVTGILSLWAALVTSLREAGKYGRAWKQVLCNSTSDFLVLGLAPQPQCKSVFLFLCL